MGIEEHRVKGAVLLGYQKFIKRKWGKAGLDSYLAATGLGEVKLKDGHWYPHNYSTRSLAWIAKEKGMEHLEECGSYTVKDLGLLSYIVRFMDIEPILKKARKGYKDAFNYGELRVEREDKRARIKVRDNADGDRNACPVWTGAFKGMLEMTRTKGTVRKTACQMDGNDWCIWEMEWGQ